MKSSEQFPLENEVHIDEFEIGTPQNGEQGRSKSVKNSEGCYSSRIPPQENQAENLKSNCCTFNALTNFQSNILMFKSFNLMGRLRNRNELRISTLLKIWLVVLGGLVWGDGFGQVSENFNGLNQGSYGNYLYNDFQITNGLCNSTNALNGNAVRLRNASSNLEYVGNDGNGKDGGIGQISFQYRSWDNSPTAVYDIQININNTGYVNIGSQISSSSTTYSLWQHTLNNNSDDIKVRVIRVSGERLHIDDFEITNFSPTNTTVQFSSATYTQNETSTTVDLCVDITNEDAIATNVDVVLTSAAGTYLSTFTQTLTFPPNSSSSQCATVTWVNNGTCDGNETYTFELQNESGGNAVAIGSQSTTELTIVDDEIIAGDFYVQDFDGTTPIWVYSGDGANLASYGNSGIGRRITNNESFELAQVPTTGMSGMLLSLKTASVGGIENADNLTVFVNLNNLGYPLSPDITIQASFGTNRTWPYTGSGVATTVAGTPSIYTGDGPTGYATIEITIPDGTTSISVLIESDNNSVGEYYYIDDITLNGMYCSNDCTEPTTEAVFDLSTPTFLSETGATLDWTGGDGDNNLVVLRENSAVSTDPVDGTSYNANPAFGTGDDIGTNEFAVYSGGVETIAITNLTPGTEYFSKVFEYNCLPGSEDYFTTGTPDTDIFITLPENPATFIEGCVGPTSIDLSWTAPANGNFDGYLLVVREGATPHAVNSLDPSSQTFNLNYASAPTFGTGGILSRVLYRGAGFSATVTNLSAGVNYTFEVFAYTIGSVGHRYSAGTTTSQTIELEDVNTLAATPAATSVALSWVIDNSCVDEIIVVAFDGGAVLSNPSGLGYTVSSNSYTDGSNPTLAGGENVVYSGLGSLINITNLTTDTEYCFKVFVRNGAVWSTGEELCETPRTTTVLVPGDLSIISVVTNTGGGDDEVCFVSYQSITTNTAIDFTDNGYERLTSGLWADSEGVIRMERTGGTIAAGTPICFTGRGNSNSDFNVYVCGVLDPDWTISSLNGISQFDMNANDQIWIMQNGSWSNPSGSHNSTYTGSVLYGWTAIGWEAAPGYNSTAGSTLFPNSSCLNTDLQTLNNDIVKYAGPTSATTKIEWITRINDDSNWASYDTYADYNANAPHYLTTCVNFDIIAGIYTEGLWNGDESTDWFDCSNWASLRLPENDIDVEIPDVTNDPIINAAGAESNNITINTGGLLTINNALSEIEISGDLIIEGTLDQSAGNIVFVGNSEQLITDNDAGVGTINFAGLEIDKSSGKLNTDEIIVIDNSFTGTNGLFDLGVTSYVHFQTSATTSGASNASFIDGPVRKTAISSTNFTFPIGESNVSGNFYQPARIFGLLSGTSTIEAQYFNQANPFAGAYYDGESNNSNDNHEIGNCDYWTITKISGSNDPTLALDYTNANPTYCNVVGQPASLRIASLNGFNLWDLTASGNISSEIVMSVSIGVPVTGGSYGDFAFYSDGGDQFNVLPITLLSFTAEARENKVLTNWITATEINNDFFTIERSTDGTYWEKVGTIDGAGDSNTELSYSFTDQRPYSGISYYRLRQTDFDGATTTSEPRAVEIRLNGDFGLDQVYHAQEGLNMVYRSNSPNVTVEIYDLIGKLVHSQQVENSGNGFGTIYPDIARGVYVLRLSDGTEVDSKKFVW